MCPKEAENWETEGIAGNPNNSQTRTDLVRLMVLRSAAVVQLYWTGLPEFSPFRYRTTYSEQRIATSPATFPMQFPVNWCGQRSTMNFSMYRL
jgi:hypothetical protein